MAYQYLWIDSFDHCGSLSEKYVSGIEFAADATFYSEGSRPYGYGRCISLTHTEENYLDKSLTGDAYSVLFVGFHWYCDNSSATDLPFVQFIDAVNNVVQVEIRRSYDSALGLHRFSLYRGSTLLATSTSGMPASQWSWLSMKCVCDPTNGEFVLRIGYDEQIVFSGNTRNGSASQMHRIRIRTGTAVNDTFRLDNLVIATGDSTDYPLGKMRIFGAIVPTANSSVQFSTNPFANWNNVDDIPPDGDDSYNYSSSAESTDLFSFALPPGLSNVLIRALKVNVRARKTDVVARSLCPVIRPWATVYEGQQVSVGTEYKTFGSMWQVNPDTEQSWTYPNVQVLKFGYRLKS